MPEVVYGAVSHDIEVGTTRASGDAAPPEILRPPHAQQLSAEIGAHQTRSLLP